MTDVFERLNRLCGREPMTNELFILRFSGSVKTKASAAKKQAVRNRQDAEGGIASMKMFPHVKPSEPSALKGADCDTVERRNAFESDTSEMSGRGGRQSIPFFCSVRSSTST